MCLAVPGRIVSVDGEGIYRSGKVDFGGVCKNVSLACVPEAELGDWVIVHVGFALSRLDEAEAAWTLDHLRQIAKLPGEPD